MKLHSRIASLAVMLAACATDDPPTEPDPPDIVYQPPAADSRATFVGVVSSRVSKVIAADFEAKIEQLRIRNGQRVRAGDVVAELDTEPLKAKLAQARGTYEAAKGQRARAGAAYANAARRARLEQRLVGVGASAPEAFNSMRSEASQFGADGASAAGQMQRAASEIEELEALIVKAKVKSPIDGVVSIVKVKEGANVSRAEHIARVFDPHQLVVRFAVPKKLASLIGAGAPIELVASEGQRAIPATVKHRDDTADPTIDFTVFEAIIEPNFRTDEIRVGDRGHVRIAGATK